MKKKNEKLRKPNKHPRIQTIYGHIDGIERKNESIYFDRMHTKCLPLPYTYNIFIRNRKNHKKITSLQLPFSCHPIRDKNKEDEERERATKYSAHIHFI